MPCAVYRLVHNLYRLVHTDLYNLYTDLRFLFQMVTSSLACCSSHRNRMWRLLLDPIKNIKQDPPQNSSWGKPNRYPCGATLPESLPEAIRACVHAKVGSKKAPIYIADAECSEASTRSPGFGLKPQSPCNEHRAAAVSLICCLLLCTGFVAPGLAMGRS